MLSDDYRKSLAEVDTIIDLMGEEYSREIPKKFIEFIREKRSKTYEPKFDANEDLEKQIKYKKTKAILALIYYNFWCEADEKKEFLEDCVENSKKQKEENVNIFEIVDNKTETTQVNSQIENTIEEQEVKEESHELIVVKQKWYKKLFKYVKMHY